MLNFVEPRQNHAGYTDALPAFSMNPQELQWEVTRMTQASAQRKAARKANFALSGTGGTLDVGDTFELWRLYNGTVLDYDRTDLGQQVAQLLAAQNHNTMEQIGLFAEVGTERFWLHGDRFTMDFQQLDAGGLPEAEKGVAFGGESGRPLRRFGIATQWTNEFWRGMKMETFAAVMSAILAGDNRLIARRLRRAFFNPFNYWFFDVLKDKYRLPVRTLLNGDTGNIGGVWSIPPSPYDAATFNNTAHNHYMVCGGGNGDTIVAGTNGSAYQWASTSATAATRAQNLNDLVQNLREHDNEHPVELFVNSSDGATYFSMDNVPANSATGVYGFVKLQRTTLVDQRLIQIANPALGTLNATDIYDGVLGYFDDVKITKKVWVPQGYIMAYIPGADKILYCRVPDGEKPVGSTVTGSLSMGNGDLRQVYKYEEYPLYSEAMLRDFEFSVNNRWGADVLMISGNTGSGSANATQYTLPAGL